MAQVGVSDVVVVGGGPAGFAAAIFAARRGLSVTLLEKGQKPLRKLRITGKGRCNLTNNCTDEEFFQNVLRGGKFLRSSERAFGPQDIMEFFETIGVPLKTERGRRVFPQSDRAMDIVNALLGEAERCGVRVEYARAETILAEDGRVSGVATDRGFYRCRAAVLATGGLSYPATGSDGDGFAMAKKLGHSVSSCVPSLVPLRCEERWCSELEGLSLKNVALRCKQGKKLLFDELGEMMFTGDGITGPLALSLSAVLAGKELPVTVSIDLKPALDAEQLDRRLLRDFGEAPNRAFKNSLSDLLPRSLIPVVIRLSGIDAEKKLNVLTAAERRRLGELLKRLPLTVVGDHGWNEAVVTAGGVSLKEVDPKTMQSKLLPGLYLAGELLDADAYTGGYNLTIAFCTGAAAGNAVLQEDEAV